MKIRKGHTKQTKQGVRSTKVIDEDAMLKAETLTKPTPVVKFKDAYLQVFDTTKKAMYTDQTSRFPITSAGGHKYTMVALELHGNYIDAEPLKLRSTKDLTEAYKRIYARWKATGVICPNWHVLDNEAPAEFLKAIQEMVVESRRHQRTYTDKTLPNAVYRHTKAISLQPWQVSQTTSQSTSGTSWYRKLYSP